MVHLQSTLPHPQILYLREDVGMWLCAFLLPLQHLITYQLPPRGCNHPPRCQALRHHSSHLQWFKLPTHHGLRGIKDEQTDGDMDSYNQVELRGTSKLPAFTTLPTVELRLLFCPHELGMSQAPGPTQRQKEEITRVFGIQGVCQRLTYIGHFILPQAGGSHTEPETRILT